MASGLLPLPGTCAPPPAPFNPSQLPHLPHLDRDRTAEANTVLPPQDEDSAEDKQAPPQDAVEGEEPLEAEAEAGVEVAASRYSISCLLWHQPPPLLSPATWT